MGYKALIILNIVLLAVIARLVFKPLSPAPGIRVWEGETWTAAQYGSRYILSIKTIPNWRQPLLLSSKPEELPAAAFTASARLIPPHCAFLIRPPKNILIKRLTDRWKLPT